jgi:hypothetical protein
MIRRPRLARMLLAVAGLASGLSCKDSSAPPPPPQDGPVNVTLTSPSAEDGAILFTVGGGTIDSVTAPAGSTLQVISNSAAQRTVLVRGTLATGTVLAQVWVQDVGVSYTATVSQAAAKTYAQRSLTGYSLSVSKP